MPCYLVQGSRSPEEQQALKDSGRGVTNAPALLSFHNYGLAFDIVPAAYLNEPDWNPEGDLWPFIGALGKSLGLEWGGDWSDPDRPHFQLTAAPIEELKAYWEKFKSIMPITLTPTNSTLFLLLLATAVWLFWVKPNLPKA